MQLFTLRDVDGSSCTLTYESENQWLRATWQGYIDTAEALRGAQQYLVQAAAYPCPYLLNDNLALKGPWFDSVQWLQHVWLPQARHLGLRYLAHVVQADTHHDILTFPAGLAAELELQCFESLPEAEEWLRSCQATTAALRCQ
ncbi:hypothetical protein KBK19_19705 [Microvirga sp. STR05]|uniref:STAS/SEC14 domain-containing protein n=1 Tax=Hymenobacter duratus TaxID=2771356 RepID=A0ABR8JN10_9BACT|nr:hypothetical protein [Hymenobacter duratus]MBD2717275.1 hypothetical protein [Hymenobacter duratus]MBR7952195.1 hypothetical protein [Microvirga sp. STR05]